MLAAAFPDRKSRTGPGTFYTSRNATVLSTRVAARLLEQAAERLLKH